MKELFNTKSAQWKNIQTNLLFVGIVELLIYNGGLFVKYAVQRKIDLFTPVVGSELGI